MPTSHECKFWKSVATVTVPMYRCSRCKLWTARSAHVWLIFNKPAIHSGVKFADVTLRLVAARIAPKRTAGFFKVMGASMLNRQSNLSRQLASCALEVL